MLAKVLTIFKIIYLGIFISFHNMLISNYMDFRACVLLFLVCAVKGYIDITLEIATSSSDVSYNLPVRINSEKQMIGLSLENKEEFIVSPKAGKHNGKSMKTKSEENKAELHVSSLEGYNLEGWRRFFL